MAYAELSQRETTLMAVISYVILAAVTLGGFQLAPSVPIRWLTVALSLVIGLIMLRMPSPDSASWRVHLYLAVQASLSAVLMYPHPHWTLFALFYFILSAQAVMLLPLRVGAAWIAVFVGITGAFGFFKWGGGGLTILPMYAGGYAFFGIFAHALVRADAARRESQELLAELQEAHAQLQEYAARAEELAVMEERGRLAREMHDTLGHRLTVAAVQLEGAQRLIPKDPERAGRMVDTVRDQVRAALGELRRTVAALREPLETGLSLSRALARLVTGFEEATGITVHQMLPEEMPDLPDGHRLTLYRAAQEALTNVQRHAQASDVWFQLSLRQETIALLVSDNGVGLPAGSANGGGFGLRGLQERAEQLGGAFYLEPRPGGGTEVSLRLPLPGGLGGGDG